MNIKDKSHIKAIIKRAITDQELMLPIIEKASRKYKNRKLTKKNTFRGYLKWYELFTRYGLIIQHVKKHKYFNSEERMFFYFDLQSAVGRRKEGERYPAEFQITVDTIDSNLNFLKDGHVGEVDFINVSTHCIERIIERSGAKDFQSAITLFSPICLDLLKFSWLLRFKTSGDKRYIYYWCGGYMVFQRSQSSSLPVIITWIPADMFNQSQTNKFINLDDEQVHIIEEDTFNNTNILKISDTESFEF